MTTLANKVAILADAGSGIGYPKRRVINIHIHLRWLHCRYVGHGCLRRQ